MGLTRKMLKEMGLEQEQIDSIMEAHGSSMSQMMSKSEYEEKMQSALAREKEEWQKSVPTPPKPTETAEYIELSKKYNDLTTDLKLSDYKVKAKYRDFVKQKLDLDKFDDSIKSIQADYAEFFETQAQTKVPETESKKAPSFGSESGKDENKSEEQKIAEQFAKAFAN